jgi:TRAP-type C4-dicarboxylate transport system permease small subunit
MKIFSIFSKSVGGLNRVAYIFCGIAVLLSAFILTYEVIVRYVLRVATIWEIEISVFLTIMATFIGAAYGLKDGAHVNIDLVTRLLPTSVQRKLSSVTSILSLIFCILIAWKGWEMWWEAYSKGWVSESLWSPPLSIPYFFLPLGMTLLSLQYIVEIIKTLRAKGKSNGS